MKEGGIFIIEDVSLITSHPQGNFVEMHNENLKYAKEIGRFADILRMKSDFGPKDSTGRDTTNNLMVILK